MNWILLIFMYTPAGDFVEKIVIPQPSQQVCERTATELPNPVLLRLDGVCVTLDHWTGQKYMAGVPLHR
jgi:hypothetical protein